MEKGLLIMCDTRKDHITAPYGNSRDIPSRANNSPEVHKIATYVVQVWSSGLTDQQ